MTDHDPTNLHGGRPPFTLDSLTGVHVPDETRPGWFARKQQAWLDHRNWLETAPDEEARGELLALLLTMRSVASALYLREDGKGWLDVSDELWRCTHQLDRACNASGRPLPWRVGMGQPLGPRTAQQPTPPTE